MIVVRNRFFNRPSFKRPRSSNEDKKDVDDSDNEEKIVKPPSKKPPTKDSQPIAHTKEGGDVAWYIPYASIPTKRRRLNEDSDEEDDEDEDEDSDEDEFVETPGRVAESVSHEPWLPIFNDRLTMFIGGIPGAGKTYLAKQMIGLLPDTDDIDVLLFTALEEKDGNFDDLDKKKRLFKIKMTPDVLRQINLKEIRERTRHAGRQTILIFDDIDQMQDPRLFKLTAGIMNDALANGRGHEKHDGEGDVHVLCTTHTVNNFLKTKYMFENSNYIALFPLSTPIKQMQLMFEKLGLDPKLCRRIIRICRRKNIRSIIIHKTVPLYMIYGDKIMLID